ncbi:hypothetical protein Q4R89_17365 [Morganella morganii]|uniref:hypothetical protein n=1 Tax=Morganella morganii TaxID=582 RepID=UPI000BFE0EA2|nr:hypothetical protein [Morganella morganii]PHH08603.1 hypothetical protein CRX48_08720 [Morganella morganii]
MSSFLTIGTNFKQIEYFDLSRKLKQKRTPKFDGVEFIINVSLNLADNLGLRKAATDGYDTNEFTFRFLIERTEGNNTIFERPLAMQLCIKGESTPLSFDDKIKANNKPIDIFINLFDVSENEIILIQKISFSYKYNELKPSISFLFNDYSKKYPSSRFSQTLSVKDGKVDLSEIKNVQAEVIKWILSELNNLN